MPNLLNAKSTLHAQITCEMMTNISGINCSLAMLLYSLLLSHHQQIGYMSPFLLSHHQQIGYMSPQHPIISLTNQLHVPAFSYPITNKSATCPRSSYHITNKSATCPHLLLLSHHQQIGYMSPFSPGVPSCPITPRFTLDWSQSAANADI